MSSRRPLNLSAQAWKQLQKNWSGRTMGALRWQRHVAGPYFSALRNLQDRLVKTRRSKAPLSSSVIIAGYWRSGSTLLHELMARDERFTFPTTYACMNPHHFVLTQAASLSRTGTRVTRPMDEMRISAASPQEDEFALLCLGARSPYEALIYPSCLAEALQLSDPRDLSQREQQQWEARFLEFASGVSLVGGGRPLLLKSPAHGCRIPTLTQLLPDAKFAIVVRDPLSILESAVRMWTRLFQLYGFEPVPEPDAIRGVILSDRLRYEAKLEEGLATLPENRFMRIRYEALAADPIGTLEQIYRSLDLEDFSKSRAAFVEEAQKREAYVARAVPPPDPWRERAFAAWSGLSAKYGYGSG